MKGLARLESGRQIDSEDGGIFRESGVFGLGLVGDAEVRGRDRLVIYFDGKQL